MKTMKHNVILSNFLKLNNKYLIFERRIQRGNSQKNIIKIHNRWKLIKSSFDLLF